MKAWLHPFLNLPPNIGKVIDLGESKGQPLKLPLVLCLDIAIYNVANNYMGLS